MTFEANSSFIAVIVLIKSQIFKSFFEARCSVENAQPAGNIVTYLRFYISKYILICFGARRRITFFSPGFSQTPFR